MLQKILLNINNSIANIHFLVSNDQETFSFVHKTKILFPLMVLLGISKIFHQTKILVEQFIARKWLITLFMFWILIEESIIAWNRFDFRFTKMIDHFFFSKSIFSTQKYWIKGIIDLNFIFFHLHFCQRICNGNIFISLNLNLTLI